MVLIMNDLFVFYQHSIKSRIRGDEFLFSKNNLEPVTVDFLRSLLDHISTFVNRVHKFNTFKKLDEGFIKNLDFIEDFYIFLRQNRGKIVFDLSNDQNEDFAKQFLEEKKLSIYYKDFYKTTGETIFDNLKITDNKKTLLFNECLSESFKSCIEILAIILAIDNQKLNKKELGDMLFFIDFELYTVMVPHHLEDMDKEMPGLLKQIKWLQESIKVTGGANNSSD